ncbi:MAG: O-antigen ligase family protein [Paracoccus sp. (in: a-proteobacteria)]
MTQMARVAPAGLIITLVAVTVFNDLPPTLPVGELSKDLFIYLFPVLFLFFILRPKQIVFPSAFTMLLMGFLASIVLSVAVNYDEIAHAYFKGRSGMNRVITQSMAVVLGPLIALMFYNIAKRGQMRTISRGAEVGLWLMMAFGVMEIGGWYHLPVLTQSFDTLSLALHARTNDYYPIRLRLTAFESSWTAVMMTFIFPFAIARASPRRMIFYAGFVMVAMILAKSRTAMLVVGFEFLLLGLVMIRRRKDYLVYAATLAYAGLLALMLMPSVQRDVGTKVSNLIEFGSTKGLIDPSGGFENVSNVTRLAAIRAGRSMFRERPLFGVGFGQYGFNYPDHIRMEDIRSWEVRGYSIDGDNSDLGWPPAYSLHIRILAEQGLVGYLLWLALILPPLIRSLRLADGTSYLGRMHLAVAMTLSGWMLLGASIDSFRFFGGWIALAVGLALPRPPRGAAGFTSRSGAAS